jgi:hypothetical protein
LEDKKQALKESGAINKGNEEALLYRSIFGVFYKNYNHEKDGKFLSKVFKRSKLLSPLNKLILYYNLPPDLIVHDKLIPMQIFPPKTSSEDYVAMVPKVE